MQSGDFDIAFPSTPQDTAALRSTPGIFVGNQKVLGMYYVILGQYGPPAAPLDPAVEAKVRASPRAEALAGERHGVGLESARARFGEAMSDEELLLRMMLPAEQVDAIGSAPSPSERGPLPLRELLTGLAARELESIEIDAPGLRLRARRSAA